MNNVSWVDDDFGENFGTASHGHGNPTSVTKQQHPTTEGGRFSLASLDMDGAGYHDEMEMGLDTPRGRPSRGTLQQNDQYVYYDPIPTDNANISAGSAPYPFPDTPVDYGLAPQSNDQSYAPEQPQQPFLDTSNPLTSTAPALVEHSGNALNQQQDPEATKPSGAMVNRNEGDPLKESGNRATSASQFGHRAPLNASKSSNHRDMACQTDVQGNSTDVSGGLREAELQASVEALESENESLSAQLAQAHENIQAEMSRLREWNRDLQEELSYARGAGPMNHGVGAISPRAGAPQYRAGAPGTPGMNRRSQYQDQQQSYQQPSTSQEQQHQQHHEAEQLAPTVPTGQPSSPTSGAAPTMVLNVENLKALKELFTSQAPQQQAPLPPPQPQYVYYGAPPAGTFPQPGSHSQQRDSKSPTRTQKSRTPEKQPSPHQTVEAPTTGAAQPQSRVDSPPRELPIAGKASIPHPNPSPEKQAPVSISQPSSAPVEAAVKSRGRGDPNSKILAVAGFDSGPDKERHVKDPNAVRHLVINDNEVAELEARLLMLNKAKGEVDEQYRKVEPMKVRSLADKARKETLARKLTELQSEVGAVRRRMRELTVLER